MRRLMLTSAIVGATVISGGSALAAPPATPTCNGLAATIVGTNGDDELLGTDGPDVIVGLNGNDEIVGGLGADTICGGNGDDNIFGDDFQFGGGGADTIFGDNGNDMVVGLSGNDTVNGGNGDDLAIGGPGNDAVNGDRGNDLVFGNFGDDTLTGGEGDDFLNGDLPFPPEGGDVRRAHTKTRTRTRTRATVAPASMRPRSVSQRPASKSIPILRTSSSTCSWRGCGCRVGGRPDTLSPRRLVAEGQGFEPWVLAHNGFQDRPVRPLRHPSACEGTGGISRLRRDSRLHHSRRRSRAPSGSTAVRGDALPARRTFRSPYHSHKRRSGVSG
jgi:hypothetical protein